MTKKPEVKEEFVRLRGRGWSYQKIADELNVSRRTLINWSKELENELQNTQKVALEGLLDEYGLTRAKRIQVIGEQLKQIRQELAARDLSAVSTGQLLDQFAKLVKLAENEIVEMEFTDKQDRNSSMTEDLMFERVEWRG